MRAFPATSSQSKSCHDRLPACANVLMPMSPYGEGLPHAAWTPSGLSGTLCSLPRWRSDCRRLTLQHPRRHVVAPEVGDADIAERHIMALVAGLAHDGA